MECPECGHVFRPDNSKTRSLLERFWQKVDVKEPHECWEWHGCLNTMGYGTIKVDGRPTLAHRVSWVFWHGRLIPDDLLIRHTCDNPRCVNPHHLLVGTAADNVRDMYERGRQNTQAWRRRRLVEAGQLSLPKLSNSP